MNRCPRLVVAVALVVQALVPFAAQPVRAGDRGDDSSIVHVSPKVRKKIADEGRARILVQFRLPRGHVPEGQLSRAAIAAQRGDIAKTRGYVLAKLKKYN